MDIREQIEKLETYAYACAADKRTSTAHIARMIRDAADTMEAMLEVVEAATGVHNVADKDCYWGDQGRAMIALDAALDKLKALQTNDD